MSDRAVLIYGFKIPGHGLDYKCSYERFTRISEEGICVIYSADTLSYYIGMEFTTWVGYEETISLAKIHNEKNIRIMKEWVQEIYGIELNENVEPCLHLIAEE